MFDSILSPIQEKWLTLSKRDQQASIALIVAMVIALVVFGVILPLQSSKTDTLQRLSAAQNTYTELVTLAPSAMANSSGTQSFDVNSINSEVRRQAARYGLELQRFEPDGERLKVWLEDARYPSVIQWLGGLEMMGITQTELTLDNRPKPGFVNVRVTFSVGG